MTQQKSAFFVTFQSLSNRTYPTGTLLSDGTNAFRPQVVFKNSSPNQAVLSNEIQRPDQFLQSFKKDTTYPNRILEVDDESERFDRRNKTAAERKASCCSSSCLNILCSALLFLLVVGTVAAIVITLIIANKTSTDSSTTTTITTSPMLKITREGDPIWGIYNTTAGGLTGGFNGIFSSANLTETPNRAIDSNLTTKYLNFGTNTNQINNDLQAGLNTGYYVTPMISNASIACGIAFATANDCPERDPLIITLEGTNSTALSSTVWTLLYSGSTGIDSINAPNRSTDMPIQIFSNTVAFRSYRLLVVSKRNNSNSVQYAEANIWGYY